MNARFLNLMMTALLALLPTATSLASSMHSNSRSGLEESVKITVRNTVKPLLDRYCGEYCMMISIKPEVESEVIESLELGFENIVDQGRDPGYSLKAVDLSIQIDQRVSETNKQRLEKIIENHLGQEISAVRFNWVRVELPQLTDSREDDELIKSKIEQEVDAELKRVINKYCPNDCILAQINVFGKMISAQEAAGYPRSQVRKSISAGKYLKVDSVDVELLMNETLDSPTRNRILKIMDTKTRFVSPVVFNAETSLFPVAPEEEIAEQKNADDPYGLEKLRRTLLMFRELAGTKEIISKSTTDRVVDSRTTSTSNSSLSSKELSESSSRNSLVDSSTSTGGIDESMLESWGVFIAALLLIGGVTLLAVLRYSQVKKDADIMVSTRDPMQLGGYRPENADGAEAGLADGSREVNHEDLKIKLRIENLKNDLIECILEAPKVAKECFSRMLLEDGVEETSKYVEIFGKIVIFELLDEQNLKRDLFALSEFVHQSSFDFDDDEVLDLLLDLKTKIRSAEIKVLSSGASDQFDFLHKLDSEQVFSLISSETPQVQSIVLTQVDQSKRSAIIDHYTGNLKTVLMEELCRADAIPKEFLWNVAKALKKKVETRPEFDTENLRSSDVLLDIMEKANIGEQRELMYNLQKTNADAARGIKLKLITIEMLPYLRDGHLLELVLGMDRTDLLVFLGGAKEHIRDLILNKAPRELADSWWEDLENMGSVEEQSYKLVQMKIFTRIRNLASNGTISLLDINEMMFPEFYQDEFVDENSMPHMSPSTDIAS